MIHRINIADRQTLHTDGEVWYEQILQMAKEAQSRRKEAFEYVIHGDILSLTRSERDILATVSMGICRLLERDGYFPISYRQRGTQWFMVFFSKEGRDDFWLRKRQATWRSAEIHQDEASYIWKKVSPNEWWPAAMGEFLFDKPQKEDDYEKAAEE